MATEPKCGVKAMELNKTGTRRSCTGSGASGKKEGNQLLQGPHQGAQKQPTTGKGGENISAKAIDRAVGEQI